MIFFLDKVCVVKIMGVFLSQKRLRLRLSQSICGKSLGMCSVMWPTIAPSQILPPITPVIDFGKIGGAQPSCNPPQIPYSRIPGSTGSSTDRINGTQERSLQHVYIRVDLCVPCKLPLLLSIPGDGCLRSSWRGGSLLICLDFLLRWKMTNEQIYKI